MHGFLPFLPHHGALRKEPAHRRPVISSRSTLPESPGSRGRSLLYVPHELRHVWHGQSEVRWFAAPVHLLLGETAVAGEYQALRAVQQSRVSALPSWGAFL